MTSDIKIGKIQSASFGMGGYQDAMFGASFTLGGPGWGVGDFWGSWATRSKGAKFSEEEWLDHHAATVVRLRDLMKAAGCNSFDGLVDKPVEVTFEDGALVSWRILTEVL